MLSPYHPTCYILIMKSEKKTILSYIIYHQLMTLKIVKYKKSITGPVALFATS